MVRINPGPPPISTFAEWAKLPLLNIPVLENEQEAGATYRVKRIGFLFAPKHFLRVLDLSDENVMKRGDDMMLPTIEIETSGKTIMHKLPVPLSSWAYDTIAIAHSPLGNPLPCEVEFGVLDGRYYAEML